VHRVAIVGGTGYTGVELLRLLARHPGVEVACVTSRRAAGTPVAEVFPSLRGHVDLRYVDPASAPLDEVALVFFATPNGTAMRQAPALLEAGLVEPAGLVADAKSGVSGAGRGARADLLLGEASESVRAYAVAGHRHHPEIVQTLSRLADGPLELTFVPHLMPMIRGISHPETRSTRGANVCRLAVHRPGPGGRVVVLSVIDNLVKGAAGQAVQNMNLMLGLPETMGLEMPALLP